MPTISSYCLETIVLNYYEKKGICSDHIGIEISNILRYLSQKICYPVLDYKKIQGDLNELSNEEKQKVFHRSKCDFQKAKAALRAEKNNDYTQSINIWKEIFGDEFPSEDDL